MIRTLINRKLVTAERELGESQEYMRHIDLRAPVVRRYGQEGLVELSLAIGASRFLPVVKRTLGYATSCSLVPIRVDDPTEKETAR